MTAAALAYPLFMIALGAFFLLLARSMRGLAAHTAGLGPWPFTSWKLMRAAEIVMTVVLVVYGLVCLVVGLLTLVAVVVHCAT
jgi:hypothetical protein